MNLALVAGSSHWDDLPPSKTQQRLVRPTSRHPNASCFSGPMDDWRCCWYMQERAFASGCFPDPTTSIQNIPQSYYCPQNLTLSHPHCSVISPAQDDSQDDQEQACSGDEQTTKGETEASGQFSSPEVTFLPVSCKELYFPTWVARMKQTETHKRLNPLHPLLVQ